MAKMAYIADEMSRQPAGTIWMVDKFGDVSFHPPIDLTEVVEEPELDEEFVDCDSCRAPRCRCDDDYEAWKDERMMIEDGR
jgi:hypothetical protein